MEDYELDILIGQGPSARSVKVPLQRFTLIGATTRTGLLTSPLRSRFGIVHRLDKDTSGLIVAAKTEACMQSLTRQVKERGIQNVYLALAKGAFAPPKGSIDAPIGRHQHQRKKMAGPAPAREERRAR